MRLREISDKYHSNKAEESYPMLDLIINEGKQILKEMANARLKNPLDWNKFRTEDVPVLRDVIDYLTSRGGDIQIVGGSTRDDLDYDDIDLLVNVEEDKLVEIVGSLQKLNGTRREDGRVYGVQKKYAEKRYCLTTIDDRYVLNVGQTKIDISLKKARHQSWWCKVKMAKRDDPKENDLVKRLLDHRIYGDATVAFLCEWTNDSRVPSTIAFPDGKVRQVGYMRDGILTFRNDLIFSAKYVRVLDYPSETKSIVVYYKVNDPAICNWLCN